VKPIRMTWDGEALRPASPYWGRLADEQFVIGAVHMVEEHPERSDNTHRHYFATINEAWKNLPEDLAQEFPTAEALRKKALVKAGFHDQQTFVASSKAEAIRLAAFMRPIDEFAVISVDGCAVVRLTPKSQNYRAMGRAEFQRSKEAVLAIVADMIGAPVAEIERQAERAAA
jgi:hypothetical protein